MSNEVCKITFDDGTWIKAELPTGDERIEYVLDHFGMFASIEALPATDAAVIVANAKSVPEMSALQLFVSPCGKDAAWLHPLDLSTGHYPAYDDWIDATGLSDDEFNALVTRLQTQSNAKAA